KPYSVGYPGVCAPGMATCANRMQLVREQKADCSQGHTRLPSRPTFHALNNRVSPMESKARKPKGLIHSRGGRFFCFIHAAKSGRGTSVGRRMDWKSKGARRVGALP